MSLVMSPIVSELRALCVQAEQACQSSQTLRKSISVTPYVPTITEETVQANKRYTKIHNLAGYALVGICLLSVFLNTIYNNRIV
jgi:hypothetical protein